MIKRKRSSFLLTVATGATLGCGSSDSAPTAGLPGSVAYPCDAGRCPDAAANAGGSSNSGTGGHVVMGVVVNPSAGGHPPGSVIMPPGTGGATSSGGVNGAGGFSHPPGVVPVPPGTGGMPFPGIIIKPPDAGH
jgi:hypothetical protein